ERVDGFGSNLRIVVVDRLQQGVEKLRRRGARLDRESTDFESGGGPRRVADFDDESETLLRGHVLHQEERELGANRLELYMIDGVVDERRDWTNRLRIARLVQ